MTTEPTRRALLQGLAAVAAAVPLSGLAASADHRSQTVTPSASGEHTGRQRVIVLGAGLAGLAAAHRLAQRGHDVIVPRGPGR